MVQRRARWLLILTALCLAAAIPLARADSISDCLSNDPDRRITGCSDLLSIPNLPPHDMSVAYSMRGLAYSIKRQFDLAMPDYDMAIKLDPNSSITLNNRAWTLLRAGTPEKGLDDVERSLNLAPNSPHALDTRAHIHQSMGQHAKALEDYEQAMLFGGSNMVKLYQCGLQAAGLYKGEADGFFTLTLGDALRVCVKKPDCDPLPPEEDCRFTTS